MEDAESIPDDTETTSHTGDAPKKQPLKIDYDNVFAAERDEIPMEVVVVASAAGDDNRRRRRAERRRRKEREEAAGGSTAVGGGDEFSQMSIYELKEKIDRNAQTIVNFGGNLADKGVKLKAYVQRLEEELERRENLRLQSEKDESGCKKLTHADSSLNDGIERDVQSSQSSELASFGNLFMMKMKDADEKPKSEQNTDDQASNAFNNEMSCLNRCDKEKRKRFGSSQQSKRTKSGLPSKKFLPWQPRNGFGNSGNYMSLIGNLTSRASSVGSHGGSMDKLTGSFIKKDASQVLNLDGLKTEKTVVLVDEEDLELVERKQESEQQQPSSTNEGKIYYPSREDPESLEIFRSELKCLDPGECLTSTIMNFYIRYLQESSSERSLHHLYFFNTYFYSKLQKAVAHQKSDKEAFFVKFRRWWRGVNIFQKAYIFLPINEDNHWSLVIICILDKEDESGPIILHLDSLGLHCSQSIFGNIKRLLKNEQEFLDEGGVALDIPISGRIWKLLHHRIDERIITVPRQTNDYDCGLFVLYYMERFIGEAPTRLRRQQLNNMFGKNWFKPQEASGLRGKIKDILQEEFHKALRENEHVWQPVCFSANAEAAIS